MPRVKRPSNTCKLLEKVASSLFFVMDDNICSSRINTTDYEKTYDEVIDLRKKLKCK